MLLSFLDIHLNYLQNEVILIFTCTYMYIYIDMYSEEGDLTYLFHICPTYQNMTLSTTETSPPILLPL